MDQNIELLHTLYSKAFTVNTESVPNEFLDSILADDFKSSGSVDSKNKQQLIGQINFFWKLIPDLKWKPQEILHEGNKYVVRSIASGSPNGDFMGLSTDGSKSFKIMTIDIHKVIEGKIVEVQHLEDWSTAMKQLKS